MPYLAVLAFDEREFHPTGGDVRAEPYGRNSFPDPFRGFDYASLAWLGMIAFYIDALAKLANGLFGNLSIDLRKVCARMFEFRVQEFLDEFSIVCKQ